MNLLLLVSVSAAALLCIAVLGSRTMRNTLKKREDRYLAVTERYGESTPLGMVSLQGGLPEHPAQGRLYCALQREGLVLYDEAGYAGRIDCSAWREVDDFILRRISRSPFKSVFLFGPFASVLFKDTFRHMVTLRYIDQDDEDNHLVLEAPDAGKQRVLAAALRERLAEHLAA